MESPTMVKFTPTRKDNIRICDSHKCEETKLNEYYNDMKLDLKFCSTHIVCPYGGLSDIVPIFDKQNYKTHNADGHRVCEYVGCNQTKNLLFIKGYWCNEHGRLITYLRFGVLGKSNKLLILLNKYREFTYRKIFNHDLYKDIVMLENELNINTNALTNLNVNKVHYLYAYSNFLYIKNKEENCSLYKKTNLEYFDDLYKGKKTIPVQATYTNNYKPLV